MSIRLLALSLLFLSCNRCAYTEDGFEAGFPLINRLNQFLVSKANARDWLAALPGLKVALGLPDSLIQPLERRLSLCGIERYFLGKDATRTGFAYKFCQQEKPECYYYLLYVSIPADKEKFISYEQFKDFREKRVDLDPD